MQNIQALARVTERVYLDEEQKDRASISKSSTKAVEMGQKTESRMIFVEFAVDQSFWENLYGLLSFIAG